MNNLSSHIICKVTCTVYPSMHISLSLLSISPINYNISYTACPTNILTSTYTNCVLHTIR